MSTKPTVVLVHGAWADASSWDGVIEQLRHAGYPVVVAANPLAGLDQDSAAVASLLRSIKGPIVLVRHSYGGAVITNAAAGNPNVKALVYIAAFAPDQGETIGGLTTRPVAHPIPALPLISYPTVNADGTTDTAFSIDPAQFRQVFAADVNPTLAADMAATNVRPPVARSPTPLSRPPGTPSRRGTSSPSRTTRSLPTSSGSWPNARTRTPSRSTARTRRWSATPESLPS